MVSSFVSQYEDLDAIFRLVFRADDPYGGNPVITCRGTNIIASCDFETGYTAEISIQKKPYLVTFTVKTDDGTLVAQAKVAGSTLTSLVRAT